MMNKKRGLLLVNLGTPDAPTPKAIRKYLAEFLWDPRVIEVPRLLWWCILRIILIIRPGKVAPAYQTVWTEQGSPLLTISLEQQCALQGELGKQYQVGLGMRYGNPSLSSAMDELLEAGCEEITVLPLYPQYSATTTAATFDALAEDFRQRRVLPNLRFIRDYYAEPAYITALANSVTRFRKEHGNGELLLFSFHGIPQRYVDNGDPYYSQCVATANAVAAQLGLSNNEWQLCFQSRVGREPWLQPYTDIFLQERGAEKGGLVDVICPGFSADCLETLEEIAIQNDEFYTEAGGEGLRYIPALNAHPEHISLLASLIR